MADLTRAFDWSQTSIGPMDQWPEVLLNHVNTLLNSRHPMFLWWGKDLVQFYNDAYRPVSVRASIRWPWDKGVKIAGLKSGRSSTRRLKR
jgi:hypothetical protein